MVCDRQIILSRSSFEENRLFQGLPADVLEQILSDMKVVRYEPGDVIFDEGEAGTCMYLVAEGRVKISKVGRGGQQETLSFIEPGSFFGEMALLDGERRSAQAAAAEPVLLGEVNEEMFQAIVEVAPASLHRNFLRSVMGRLRRVNDHFISEVMRSERLSLVGTMANSIIHDLKTPITVISCCADRIISKGSDPEILEYADIIKKSLQGMTNMTQELLDYARGSTSLEFSEASFCQIIEDLESQVLKIVPKPVYYFKDLKWTGTIRADTAKLHRVLMNLIKNSIEAMRKGGVLKLCVSRGEGEWVSIVISDTGCGIPQELLARVFEPFVTSGKANGTGLGMAIAKTVVEAHGGNISLASKVGEGTQVRILLPLNGPEDSESADEAA